MTGSVRCGGFYDSDGFGDVDRSTMYRIAKPSLATVESTALAPESSKPWDAMKPVICHHWHGSDVGS
jgi:hypothetical protein